MFPLLVTVPLLVHLFLVGYSYHRLLLYHRVLIEIRYVGASFHNQHGLTLSVLSLTILLAERAD